MRAKTMKLCKDIYLPGNVCLPAPPGLTKMLQNGPGFVLFDSFRHHVQDVMHHSCSQLQVKVRLHTLFCHSLCNSLGVAT